MKRKPVIVVEDLHKTFRIPHEKNTSMKQAAIHLFKRNRGYTDFHVIKGINFEVKEGEFFGIIGRNGCGKSTLLKILAGIYTIDSGKVQINGKVSPFLELGVGFNPELTGRENVFLNGAILGLPRKEIEEKYHEIVEFSELEEFMDQRLKNYSSGMQVRLAFSVAIHAHAPIILLDEVLAVGDARFQEKCSKVFSRLKKEGRTIIFVSHGMDAVRKFCDRVILLDSGKIVFNGGPTEAAVKYEELNGITGSIEGTGKISVSGVKIKLKDDFNFVKSGNPLTIKFTCNNLTDFALEFFAEIGLFLDDKRLFYSSSKSNNISYIIDAKSKKEITVNIESVNLGTGRYTLGISTVGSKDGEYLFGNRLAAEIDVVSSLDDDSLSFMKYSWEK